MDSGKLSSWGHEIGARRNLSKMCPTAPSTRSEGEFQLSTKRDARKVQINMYHTQLLLNVFSLRRLARAHLAVLGHARVLARRLDRRLEERALVERGHRARLVVEKVEDEEVVVVAQVLFVPAQPEALQAS